MKSLWPGEMVAHSCEQIALRWQIACAGEAVFITLLRLQSVIFRN